MSSLIPFTFDSKQIRVTNLNGDPWFALRDVLSAINTTTKTTHAILSITQHLGGDHVVRENVVDALGRNQQQAVFVSEQAFYLLLMRGQMTRSLVPQLLSKISGYREIISALHDFEVPDDLPDMYVYAIREKDTGNIKLGISRDPESRLRQLQTGNSSELELVAFRKSENRFADERALHADAEAYRLRGEWFAGSAMEVMQS